MNNLPETVQTAESSLQRAMADGMQWYVLAQKRKVLLEHVLDRLDGIVKLNKKQQAQLGPLLDDIRKHLEPN